MKAKVMSTNERILFMENYSAPLRVFAIDSDSYSNKDFNNILSQMLVLNPNKIMEHARWKQISNKVIESVQNEIYIPWATSKMLLQHEDSLIERANDKIDANRQEIIKRISEICGDQSRYACISIRNIIYLASEGALNFDPYEDNESNVLITPVMRQYIYDNLIINGELKQEEFSYWLKTTSLLLQPVSREFKEEFATLFDFHIPFGLSPKTESITLQNLLTNPRHIALIPLATGALEVGKAITAHEWGVALLAAGASGATFIVFLSAVAISELVYLSIKAKMGK